MNSQGWEQIATATRSLTLRSLNGTTVMATRMMTMMMMTPTPPAAVLPDYYHDDTHSVRMQDLLLQH